MIVPSLCPRWHLSGKERDSIWLDGIQLPMCLNCGGYLWCTRRILKEFIYSPVPSSLLAIWSWTHFEWGKPQIPFRDLWKEWCERQMYTICILGGHSGCKRMMMGVIPWKCSTWVVMYKNRRKLICLCRLLPLSPTVGICGFQTVPMG